MNVILLLKNSCAGGHDIPAYVIKRCIHVYIEPLTHIIDKSIKEGVFPLELKLVNWYLNELCIIISLTLLTLLTFSINTNLDLDINTLLNRLSSL